MEIILECLRVTVIVKSPYYCGDVMFDCVCALACTCEVIDPVVLLQVT